MSNYMPSSTIHPNIVKTGTPVSITTIAHDADRLSFDGTILLNITHAYGDKPKLDVVRAGRRDPFVSVNRTTDLVEIEFADLVVGSIAFNDVDEIITITIK